MAVEQPVAHGTSAVDLVELLAASARQVAALQAFQAGAVGALLTTPEFTVDGPPKDLVDELAARMTLTTSAAEALVAVSDRLTRCLPATLAALAQGRTDWPRAQVVAVETNLLTDDQAAWVDEQVAEAVELCTTGRLRALVRALIAELDPEAVRRRARREVADRSVRYFPLPDGIGELVLRGPATELRCAFENLTAIAKDVTRPGAGVDPHAEVVEGVVVHHPGDGDQVPPQDQRGLDAKRYDVAVSQLTGSCPDAPGIGAGRGPQVFVLLSTALGLDEASGELVGHGPIPASHLRTLLADHRFRRVLTDPVTGQVAAVDGHSYPPGTLPDLSGEPEDEGPDLPDGGSGPDGPDGPQQDPVAPEGVGKGAGLRRAQLLGHDTPQDRTAGRARSRARCPVAAAGGGDYAIPRGTRRLVEVRSRRCAAPGCRAPATRSDTDHVVEWPLGPTCACNLVPLCRRHHGLKTRRRWWLRSTTDDPRDATVTWTTVLGYRYVVAPDPLLRRGWAGLPPPSTVEGSSEGVGERARLLWAAGYPAHDRAASDLVERSSAAAEAAAAPAAAAPWWAAEPAF